VTVPTRRGRGPWPVPTDQRGQVAIVVALTLTVMLAFGALVVDVGLNWAARTQLQSAADAAALAGAAELPGQPDEALAKVRQYLDDNVAGLAGAPGWEGDGDAANGDVTCYSPPAPPPPPGDPAHGCTVGDTAIQVITPPLQPTYAFASILGRSSAEIKALAAAGAPPGPDAPCALCVLSPGANPGLLADGDVALTVAGGGVVVNSDAGPAAVTTGPARVTVSPPGTIRVVGGVQSDPGGGFDPVPQTGGVPVADPLSNLPRPDQLGLQFVPPTFPVRGNVNVGAGSRVTLQPGIYHQIQASGGLGTTLSFSAGLYVITGELRVSGSVTVTVGSATLYFACSTYPRPCGNGNNGAGLTVGGNVIFTALGTSDLSSPYNGLAIFYDRNNTNDLVLGGGTLSVTGSIYAQSAHLGLSGNSGAASLKSMVVVGSFAVSGATGRDFGLTYLPDLNVSLRTSAGGLVK
jgi:hypothetical protein